MTKSAGSGLTLDGGIGPVNGSMNAGGEQMSGKAT